MKDSNIANFFASALSEKYLPAVIVVDAEFNLRHVTDPAKKYLTVPNDPSIPKLTRMIPAKLAVALQVALIKVRNEALSHSLKGIKAKIGMQLMTFDITIEPFLVPKEVHNDQLYSIILHEGNTEEWETDGYENETFNSLNEINLTLKQEVDDLTQQFQSKEHELNEELMQIKEELLNAEKNNDTFQSIHEDLQKLNSDYRFTISELTKSKSYLEHQIESLGIPFLFLDEEVNIHKFSTGIFQLVNIRQADIGRPIKHYTSVFRDFSIHTLAEDVLASGSPMEDSVLTKDEERYLVKGLPYQTTDNEHQGVVVIFYLIAQTVLENILPQLAEPLPTPLPETPVELPSETPVETTPETSEELIPETSEESTPDPPLGLTPEAPLGSTSEIPQELTEETSIENPEEVTEVNALFTQPTIIEDGLPPLPEVEVAEIESDSIEEESSFFQDSVVEEAPVSEIEEVQEPPFITEDEHELEETAQLAEEEATEEAIEEATEEDTEAEEEVIAEVPKEETDELATPTIQLGESQSPEPEAEIDLSKPEEEKPDTESIIDETPQKVFPTDEPEIQEVLETELPQEESIASPAPVIDEIEEVKKSSFVAPEFEDSFLAVANENEAPQKEEYPAGLGVVAEEELGEELMGNIVSPEAEIEVPVQEVEDSPAEPMIVDDQKEINTEVGNDLSEVEDIQELTEAENLSVNGTHPKSPDLTQDLIQASEVNEPTNPDVPTDEKEEVSHVQEPIEVKEVETDPIPQFSIPEESVEEEEPFVQAGPETSETLLESALPKAEPKEERSLSFLEDILTENTSAPKTETESLSNRPTSLESAPEFIELDDFDFEEEEEEVFSAPKVEVESASEPESPVFPEFEDFDDSPANVFVQETVSAPDPVELPTPLPVDPQPEASMEMIQEELVADEEPPMVTAPEPEPFVSLSPEAIDTKGPELEAASETVAEADTDTQEINPDAFPMYQKYFPASYDGFIVFDFQSQKVIYTDAKIPEILGFQEEELVGMHIMELSPLFQEEGILSSERMKQYFKKTLIVGQVAFEWKLQRKDQRSVWMRASGIALPGEEINHLLFAFKDISEEKAKIFSQDEAELKMNMMTEKNYDGVIFLDAATLKPASLTQKATKLFNCTREEFYKHSPKRFMPHYQQDGRPSEEVFNQYLEIIKTKESVEFDWWLRKFDGAVFRARTILYNMVKGNNKYIVMAIRELNPGSPNLSAESGSGQGYR